MAKKVTKTGKKLEKQVVQAYRNMGARKVEHDVELAGNQIDLYVELETSGRLLHRIAVEAKDWASPVGIEVVNHFATIVELLRGDRLIDEGVIVSAKGFSKQARNAAATYGLKLFEPADLEAMVDEAKTAKRTQPQKPLIPLLPLPYFVHPYPIQPNFTGRVYERKLLTNWFTTSSRPILAMIAMGGMGKSALTWAWLRRDVLGLPLPGYADEPTEIADTCRLPEAARPSGVLWWSFYERDARFANFVNEALRYASAGRFDPASLPSPYERVQALFNLLQRQRLLLVLDGLERELRAYASLNAAYQGDGIDEQQPDHVRRCIDSLAAKFLQDIASMHTQSRVLLTSRLLPAEVEGLAGCRAEELLALAPEDAVAFFHNEGIKGTRAEIEETCRPYGYHPLALRLLAGVIVRDQRFPRDIKAAKRHPVLQDLKGKAQHHVLQVAYEALAPKPRDLLSRLAAFRSPTAYATLAALKLFEKEEQLEHALEELRERGLLFFDAEAGRYDLHPVVRQYSYDRLADKAGVHTQLRDYFSTVPSPEEDKIQTLEDLTPVIELYHHTARAGKFDEACDLFHDRINKATYYRFGAYQLRIELLRVLFPEGEDKPPRLKEESDQAWTLNRLANTYSISGQPRRAADAFKLATEIAEKVGNKKNLAIGLENLAFMAQIPIGALAAAEHNLRRSIDLCREIGDEYWEAAGHQELGRLLAYRREFEEVRNELDLAYTIAGKLEQIQHQGLTEAYRAQRALLMGDYSAALIAAQKSRELAEDRKYEHDFVLSEWLLSAALTGLAVASSKKQDELLAENDRKTAQHHAAIAYERAWCDGPPHCYKPALEEAERLLKALGVKPAKVMRKT